MRLTIDRIATPPAARRIAQKAGNRLRDDKAVYTIREVAELTGYSRQTVERLFENERGVLILERPERMHKRAYRSIRIPRFVYDRVVAKLSVR